MAIPIEQNPRIEILQLIKEQKLEEILPKAAQMHGHYCPGLAMGVIAATYAMNQIQGQSDGMEDLLAITETNNCFSDGIQFVTGCSFGNNALIFKDLGKTAFTLTKRDGNGIRLIAKAEAKQEIRKAFPEFSEAYQKVVKEKDHSEEALKKYKELGIKRAFATLTIPAEKLFTIQKVQADIPDYAPSHDSYDCVKCGESTMATRTVQIDGKPVCFSCAGERYFVLERDGIGESEE